MTALTDVFGKVHLGYLVIETEKFDDWRRSWRAARVFRRSKLGICACGFDLRVII